MAPEAAAEVQALADWTAGIADVIHGRMADAVRRFDAAAAGLQAAGLPDPAAQTQVPKIMALAMLGRHDEAAACAEAAQRELRALGNLPAAGRVSLNIGGLHLRRDAYAQAVPHYREAAVLFARIRDHAHSVTADIGLADALTAMGEVDEGRRVYARAAMRAQTHGLELSGAIVDESLALLELARGHYREALAGFESARRRYERLAMPHYVASAEKQLADVYLELNLLPEALALLEKAVAEWARLECPPELAAALAQRGRSQLALGDRGAAERSFAQAAALFAQQQNTVGAANVALARADLALAGGNVADALDFAQDAASGFAAAGQADGAARAEVQAAEALLAASRRDEAAARFAATLERARAGQQLAVQARCLTGQGSVAMAAGDRPGAAAAFDAAIELLEDQRRVLPVDELRAAFLSDHLRPYRERLRIALDAGDAAAVLEQLERFRARALGERLAEAPDVDAKRERLAWLYRRVQRLQADEEASPVLADELRRTEHELLEAARRERLASPVPEAAGADGFSVAALQAALAPGDALVEYGEIDAELFALVVTRERVQLERGVANKIDAQDSVRAMRFQIDALRHGVAPVRAHLATLTQRAERRLRELHDRIWAPLVPLLAGAARVLVVPTGVLAAVPFAALADGSGALGERHLLAVAPSARVALRGLQSRPPAPRSVLALGESSRLPHAATEAAFVASLFEDGRALVGGEATLAALQSGAAGADILHLACHARFRADNPRFSALQLHDGPLTVDLAEALPLAGGTVVLSACETGLADAGAEAVGLVRGFLVGGASRVLASLWPVDDAVTAETMTTFYRELRAGAGAAEALQRAQAALKRRLSHPHFWGAFVVHGGF